MSQVPMTFGWQAHEGTELMDLIQTLREALEPVHRSLVVARMALHAADVIDEADMAGLPRRSAVIFDALQRQTRAESETDSGLREGHPLTAQLLFDTDPETRRLYLWGDVRYAAYARAVDETGAAAWFPYWSESAAGRPYGTTAAAWQERSLIWGRVLRGMDPADPSGRASLFIGSPPGAGMLTEAKAVFEALPTVEERVIRWMDRDPERPAPPDMTAYRQEMTLRAQHIHESLKTINYEDIAGAAS